MTNKRRLNSVYMAVLALCLFAFGVLGGRQMLSAFAKEEKTYTNVLADLQKDSTFSLIDYPERDMDYLQDKKNLHLQVIQIAESTSGELYLYTYQPCQKVYPLTATEINMSLAETVDGTSLFPLTLLNTNGVFCKYLVNAVTVSSDETRYYNITSIYRDYIESIDDETGNDNTRNGVVYSVGKVFKAETKDGVTSYSAKKVDVIQILNPYAGFLSYYDGLHWDFLFDVSHYTDVHFIAFDTDYPIDLLQEVDISYYTQSYEHSKLKQKWTYGDTVKVPNITLTGEQTGGNAADGFLGIEYTWKRIQKSADFKKSVELSEEAQKEVDKTKWVLVFLETPFTEQKVSTMAGHDTIQKGTKVSEVTILRLKFVTGGKTYNLGTVSDKITESEDPVGGEKPLGWLDKLCKWLEQITGVPAFVWKIIICSLPFLILLPILSAVFPVVGQILTVVLKAIGIAFVWLCKGLWWLICLPFRGIAALVRKIKKE